ncbi:hypothetical protein EDD90_2130 [Streptomyces sp. Ag109_O5-1]|uniref:hypothetical protein n=1 Tax=Streptomyces sp. Ag109_O5-1 TaxID=1938851 RepID=UPI000F514DDB|nr:hypothetical protein [Streptomyces sp. Ag109_O5-1]RPE39158.1 hypothetical protein EDD90_2130 [Streptomyces sp. Ag109_O5-1]
MKSAFRRTFQVALTTFVATATMGVFATSASAAPGDNTWISNRDGMCITVTGGGNVYGTSQCGWGNRAQLWERVGSQIKLAYTNICLDSDASGARGWTGHVYWGECNGGNFQNWDYVDAGGGWVDVRDRETKLFLVIHQDGIVDTHIDGNSNGPLSFYGGE